MTKRLRKTSSLLAVALIASGALAAAQDAAVDREVAALSKKLMADPLDETSATKLEKLRNKQRQQRNDALAALIKGLKAYLAGRPSVAAIDLKTAAAVRPVADMAERMLPMTLDSLIRKCRRGEAGNTMAAGDVCVFCGNTGWADCPKCFGAGVRVCPDCKGTGKLPRTAKVLRVPRCGGTGALPCDVCKGKGVVRCTHCTNIPEGAAEEKTREATDPETAAIRRCMIAARYMQAGGIDFDDAAERAVSPKLAE